jgi:RNase adaptor protein for sRNA GlmZ degradation
MTPPPTLVLTSFGYRHAPPPDADIVLDLRPWLRDPAAAEWCLPLTGRDARVRKHVLSMPGAAELLAHLEGAARTLLRLAEPGRRVVLAVGCAGGRHRSVVLTEELAGRLGSGWSVEVRHEHAERPAPPARVR